MNRLDTLSSANALLLVCGVLVLSAFIAAGGRQSAQPVVAPTPALPILILPTHVPTAAPTAQPVVVEMAQPTLAVPTPEPQIIVERQVIVQQIVITATPEPIELQTFAIASDEEPLTPAQLREAQDQ